MGANSESIIPSCKKMASGGNNPFLPWEIICYILKMLPVKSIVRFLCVCKEWKKLFKTPFFIAKHLEHCYRNSTFLLLHELNWEQRRSSLSLFNHKMETVDGLSIPFIDSFKRCWSIIGSCNGLLCVLVNHDGYSSPCSIWLWNPMIREIREIPNTLNDYRRSCILGFGYSSVVDDYKIVRFYNQELLKKKKDQSLDQYNADRVEVFSLSTFSWKELVFEGLQHTQILSQAFHVNGVIFWLGLHNLSRMVISFDIATEVFTLTPFIKEKKLSIPTPKTKDDKSAQFGLAVYENRLEGQNVIEEELESNFISIQVMEEVASESGKSFTCTRKHRIGPMSNGLRPACIWKNKVVCIDIKEKKMEGDPKCVLNVFDLHTNERRKFNCSIDSDRCAVFNYVASLVSVMNTQVE